MTIQELMDLPDTKRDELVAGVRYVREPCGHYSVNIAMRLAFAIDAFISSHQGGTVSMDPAGYVLQRNPDTVRCPDVAFLSATRLPEGISPEGLYEGAPDLAAEVVSPSDRASKVIRKVGEYLEAGTPLVWVIWPKQETVQIFRPGEDIPVTIDRDGTLDGEEILPGFQMLVAELFRPGMTLRRGR